MKSRYWFETGGNWYPCLITFRKHGFNPFNLNEYQRKHVMISIVRRHMETFYLQLWSDALKKGCVGCRGSVKIFEEVDGIFGTMRS